jgi:demethoxyubiquinone hydroxylase (CLK1/Coq7/Cat5 family)
MWYSFFSEYQIKKQEDEELIEQLKKQEELHLERIEKLLRESEKYPYLLLEYTNRCHFGLNILVNF